MTHTIGLALVLGCMAVSGALIAAYIVLALIGLFVKD